jgi:hypothetical protein
MRKKEGHKRDLIDLFDGFVETGDAEQLIGYLASHSNLPGRRANLELAEAFAEVIEEHTDKEPTPGNGNQSLWELCANMSAISEDEAPVNNAREFIPFCGAVGIGAIGSASPEFFEKALTALGALANDPRWRMREAVRMGLQRLMIKRNRDTLKELDEWAVTGSLLEMRAAAAAVADPAILRDTEIANLALRLHCSIIDRALGTEDRKSEDFKTLRKALGYTLSLVICALPEEGFAYMRQLAESQDPDGLWIVKQNLRKNRLVKNLAEEVASMKRSLP